MGPPYELCRFITSGMSRLMNCFTLKRSMDRHTRMRIYGSLNEPIYYSNQFWSNLFIFLTFHEQILDLRLKTANTTYDTDYTACIDLYEFFLWVINYNLPSLSSRNHFFSLSFKIFKNKLTRCSRIFVSSSNILYRPGNSFGPSWTVHENFFISKWVIGQWLENFRRLSENSLGSNFTTKNESSRKMMHWYLKNRYFRSMGIFRTFLSILITKTSCLTVSSWSILPVFG